MNRVFDEVNKDNRIENVLAYQALLAQGITEIQPDLDKMHIWRSQAEASINNLVKEGALTQESLDLLKKHLAAVRSEQYSQSGT